MSHNTSRVLRPAMWGLQLHGEPKTPANAPLKLAREALLWICVLPATGLGDDQLVGSHSHWGRWLHREALPAVRGRAGGW